MPRYRIEVRKEIGPYAWSNTWHIEATGRGAADQTAIEIAAFERRILSSTVTVLDVKTSAWPNPSGVDFTVQPIGLNGIRSIAAAQPAEMCLLAIIPAQLGRPGRKWLRMSLDESDTNTTAGEAVLNPSGGWAAAWSTAVQVLEEGLTTNGSILLVGGNPVTARSSLNTILAVGIGFHDTDVGWYNKSATPPA